MCACNTNPFLRESPLDYGAPEFDKIKNEHYLPAFKKGIEEAREIHKEGNNLRIVPDYDTNEVSSIVSRTISKYIDIVNKETWLK